MLVEGGHAHLRLARQRLHTQRLVEAFAQLRHRAGNAPPLPVGLHHLTQPPALHAGQQPAMDLAAHEQPQHRQRRRLVRQLQQAAEGVEQRRVEHAGGHRARPGLRLLHRRRQRAVEHQAGDLAQVQPQRQRQVGLRRAGVEDGRGGRHVQRGQQVLAAAVVQLFVAHRHLLAALRDDGHAGFVHAAQQAARAVAAEQRHVGQLRVQLQPGAGRAARDQCRQALRQLLVQRAGGGGGDGGRHGGRHSRQRQPPS